MTSPNANAVAKAEEYYDSDDADKFYFTIWGGKDIHIGLYKDDVEPVGDASHRTDETIAAKIENLGPDTKVLDIGAAYGGAARYLAETYGCHVTCVNISDKQNAINREMSEKAGLSDKITVKHGSFEDIPAEDNSFDVVWSQDSILHSGNRVKVMEEVARVLKPGGQFIFTDPMQSDNCPADVLQPILDRIHLSTLGSPGFYEKTLTGMGFEKIGFDDHVDQLRRHYFRVGQELKKNYDKLVEVGVSREYIDNMIKGLEHWVNGADKGYLAWGIMHYRKAK